MTSVKHQTTTDKGNPPVTSHDREPPEDPYNNVVPYPTTTPPAANLEAEQALIAALIAAPQNAPTLLHTINPEDFYEPRNENIWHALQTINNTNTHPDHIALIEQLTRTGKTNELKHLHNYTGGTTNPHHAAHYAHIIREHATQRRTITALRQALQAAETPQTTTPLTTTLAHAMDAIDKSVQQLHQTTTHTTQHANLTGLLTTGIPQPEPPTICRRQDGHALFYTGRVNGLYGDPETAKSWIAQMAIVETLTNGKKAALIDADHNGPTTTTHRLQLLGAPIQALANPNQFRYYEPHDAHDLEQTITQATTWAPHIAVLDSLGELLPMHGTSSNDNDEITNALRALANPLANNGACVITIDHLPKNQDARNSGYAIGGIAKKRAMDGALIHVETKTPAAPGQTGRMTLKIEKDRPGKLREHSTGKYAGTFTLDSTRPNQTIATIDTETPITADGQFRPTGYMEKVSRYVENHDQATFNDIRDHIGGRLQTIKAAIDALINEGWMTTLNGPRNSKLHVVTATYREDEDTTNE